MKQLLLVLLLLIVSIAVSGDKIKVVPVYSHKSVEINKLEEKAKDLTDKKKNALDFVATIDREMLVMQGQFSVYQSLPDSFIIRYDTLKNVK